MSADNAEAALGAGVVRLLAPNPSPLTGRGTNTYLVTSANGCAVIDPGPLIASHLQRIVDVSAEYGGVGVILITHGHPDHVEGAARLAVLTGAPIRARSGDAAGMGSPLTDGDEVTVGERRLVALHTPGHRFDHLCFLLEDARTLFAGDLVAGEGTVVIVPGEGDMADYLASLRRLLALDLRQILPGHGPPIERPRALLEQYIRHRLEREQQVVAALASGDRRAEEVVARIYSGLDPRLRATAALSVTAHLLKLEREGRVRRVSGGATDGLWTLTLSPGTPRT